MVKEAPSTIDLPELQDTLLDEDTVDRLLEDIRTRTSIIAVVPKGDLGTHSTCEKIPHDSVLDAFIGKSVHAMQIRYLYDDEEWWDTLMHTPGGVRLVRINQTNR